MPAISAIAPGKVILFGEHAVVYDRPALAIPVHQVRVKTTILANPKGHPDEVWIDAPEIGLKSLLGNLPSSHAMAILLDKIKDALGTNYLPAMRITIRSTVPVAAGLGSGAAVSVSVSRALSTFLGRIWTDEQVSALAYEIEKKHHGTPSGIDNTVITYGQPILFQRGQPFEIVRPGVEFTLVIADSGIKCPTSIAVGGVRERWQVDRDRYERIFDRIGEISTEGKCKVEAGELQSLGALMNENHQLLVSLGVSLPSLDSLVQTALAAGAWGAKLSGGGLGGNILALVDSDSADKIAEHLRQAGADRTIICRVGLRKP